MNYSVTQDWFRDHMILLSMYGQPQEIIFIQMVSFLFTRECQKIVRTCQISSWGCSGGYMLVQQYSGTVYCVY